MSKRYYKGASIMFLARCQSELLVILFGDSECEIHMDLGGRKTIVFQS